jgi:hypothetical protein
MAAPHIESYRFGLLIVDGQPHTKDLLILPDQVIGGWWREEGHRLLPTDLEAVFEAQPQVLVVGQGAFGRVQIAPETLQALQTAGIEVIVQSTEQACDTYNKLREQRAVAAALHLTC